ncbi:MAG: efflux RND transporter periplasmic adaptor subunit [Nitrospirota bacterium]
MKKKYLILIIVALLIIIALYKILPLLKPKPGYLTVSGRVEADETELAVRIPGRLTKVLIDDGTAVKRGDLVALLEDEELKSKRKEFRGKIEELNEKIRAAEFDLTYTVKNIKHTIDEEKKVLAIAEARLKEAEARRENAEREFRRYSNLLEKEAISEQKYENIRLAYVLSQEEVSSSAKEFEKAKVSLLKAEDSRELIKAKEKELLALGKAHNQLGESLRQVEINLGYTRLSAPSDGIILKKVAEPGEVLPLAGVVGVMINPEDVYAKTYLPEKHIGRIYINMKAEVFTDAYPDQPLTGYICYISDKAEFTPKEVQSYEERVKEVFAVKICFPHREEADKKTYQVLKKGMPVDVRFKINGKIPGKQE